MKILLIDNSSLTPIENKLMCEKKTGEFALDLVNLGNEVKMFGQIVPKESIFHSFEIKRHRIKVKGINRLKNKLINYANLYIRVIPEVIKSDFIYIFYPNSFKYVALLCLIFRKPYGLYIRGENDLNTQSSALIFKKSEKIFTVTNYFTNLIKNISKKNNVETIRPMINLNEKDIVFPIYKNNKKYNVLFLARLELDKGIFELIYAVEEMLKNGFDIHVTVVGDGSVMSAVSDLLIKLNISKNISLEGAIFDVEKIKNFYTNADVYILPTYHEGFPRTLYEAMIYGTPIITTFVGGIPALMSNRINCLKIDKKSVESIYSAIEYSINNPEDMLRMATNAQKLVESIIDSNRLTHAQSLNKFIHNSD